MAEAAVNVAAAVDPRKLESLRALLHRLREDPGGNDTLPFGRLPAVHFARLVVLPATRDRRGGLHPPTLVLTMNVDGDTDSHLRALAEAGGDRLAALLAHCRGFPAGPAAEATLGFLRRQRVPVRAFYVNYRGRSLAQVDLEARLHEELQRWLDESDTARLSPIEIRRRLQEHVRATPKLAPALEAQAEPRTGSRTLGQAWIAVLALGGAALALLLPLTLLGLVLLRVHEMLNRADHYRPPNAHVRRLEADEDQGVHNQFSATGRVQPGPFRWLLLRVGLYALDLAARHLFDRGRLSGVDTIHFARWVLLDGGRRLYFFSNYDGSAESYQDDFIERVAFGLNLVFSNGAGWPRTRYLLFGGASDEQSFKAFYRDHQVETALWYRAPAYKGLTAVNLANNAAIRAGLHGDMDETACRAWLRRF